jgi:hypothetical protein
MPIKCGAARLEHLILNLKTTIAYGSMCASNGKPRRSSSRADCMIDRPPISVCSAHSAAHSAP